MKIAVESSHTVTITVFIGSLTCKLTREEAIDLAAQLAFMASGDLVNSRDNNRVLGWNLDDSRFFKRYRELIGTTS